ncbi:hypothetical protein BGZ61DRAFT_473887 [Ilyonectria robusta]|uniref:uncharacterized protein n=1 Tax=Ilyonectria robusta TaxID=1079257 RepID=UPI001E8E3F4A|nr:uncharacterized protein BGZ61DRAFT_473887 [Ilyonectria robusta]KAH8735282.1 hypothetical protein BGZ61DRAFT_473887 [Ilyonectria robusta]
MATQASSAATPLAFMDVLSPTVAYFDPGAGAASSSNRNPHLIILLTWNNARDEHISKYVTQHRARFPNSRILLVRCTFVTWIRPSLRRRTFETALPVLRDLAVTAGTEGQEPKILVHIFSNGGVASARTLWDLWTSGIGGDEQIPRYAVVMDSCPGFWTYKRNYHVIMSSLPSWAWPLAHAVMVISWLEWISQGRHGPHEINAEALNESGFTSREVRRTYVYGTEDKAVGWDHVEAHAEEARERGVVVRMEKFPGGQHVSHARVDADRYWGVVNETWETSK